MVVCFLPFTIHSFSFFFFDKCTLFSFGGIISLLLCVQFWCGCQSACLVLRLLKSRCISHNGQLDSTGILFTETEGDLLTEDWGPGIICRINLVCKKNSFHQEAEVRNHIANFWLPLQPLAPGICTLAMLRGFESTARIIASRAMTCTYNFDDPDHASQYLLS